MPSPFAINDLVTGKDKSYLRSVYKYIGHTDDPESGIFELVTYKRQCVDYFRHAKARSTVYTFKRRYDEFVLASSEEIAKSNKTRATYMLCYVLDKLGVGSAHDYTTPF